MNGEPIENGISVAEPGYYVLTVMNGDKETVISFTINEAAPEVTKGDFDGDSEIMVADALAILRVAAKLTDTL